MKNKIVHAALFFCGCLPVMVVAQAGFGVGDEQQQLAQLQQLQQPQENPALNNRFAALDAPGAVAASVPISSNDSLIPAAQPGEFAATPEAVQKAESYPAFIPYAGPSNRPIPLSSSARLMNDAAFDGVIKNTFPMSTEQIHTLRQTYDASQAAAAAAPGVPPRPTVTSQMVSIAPGSTPPVVRLAQGFVSSLVFVDSSGAPWPLEAYDIGNPSAFSIQWNHKDNTLMIQSMTLYTYGNLAVRLKGLATPVMLTLIPGQSLVDYRVDLRIQGLGPNAKPMVGNSMPDAASPALLGVLDGVPPNGGKNMEVSGGEAQAWLVQDKLYLRTRLTVLSPAWTATMSSADGMKAYELQKTPMILASFQGKPIQLRVEGF